MPEERNKPAPQMDQAEWDRVREGVPRETQAARLIAGRAVKGAIPYVPYMRGDGDNAPVLRAVAGFAGKVYALLDSLEGQVSEEAEAVYAAMEKFDL